MKKFTLVMMILCAVHLYGQDSVKQYSFIDYSLNRLNFGNDSSSFLNFYQKLDSFASHTKKQITIAHIGGSHVQGGTWSQAFVDKWNEVFVPAGGSYFVFPFKLAKTNSPHYATSYTNMNWKRCRSVGKEFCQPLGMSAMNVNTNDSAGEFGIALTRRAMIKAFNTVKIYHNFNPSFELTAIAPRELKSVRIDKIDEGYTQFDIEEPVDSLRFLLVKKDTIQKDFILYGSTMESNLANGIFLASLGANGASSASFLRCEHFANQLRTLSPDLVILSLGVNDSQAADFSKENYIAHYDSLITKIKIASPSAAILLTTTTDNFIRRRTPNKRTEKTKDAMFELMEKHKLGVWDLYNVMGGYKSMLKWQKAALAARDRVHFSPKGYNVLGQLMFDMLYTSYKHNSKK